METAAALAPMLMVLAFTTREAFPETDSELVAGTDRLRFSPAVFIVMEPEIFAPA